jgi:bifunctional non-homologous end joining protein LigD
VVLEEYKRKRNPERTPEPFGRTAPASAADSGGALFVVQKHAARRLHYDLRLEMEGVLRSWAVPKGPTLKPGDKRLAVMVEDHPIEYADFEGVISPGNYGAGAVIVWDRGRYRVIDPPGADPATAVRNGKLDIELHGHKLRGAFTLVRTRAGTSSGYDRREQWLFIKKRDSCASEGDVTALHPRSVLSGLTIDELRDAPALEKRIIRDLEGEGVPIIRGALEPKRFPLCLGNFVDGPFDDDNWLFEVKHDGVRALAIRDGASARLFARSRAEITLAYPEIAQALNSLPFERFVLDGEIVAVDQNGRPNFQLLQRRMQVRNRTSAMRLSGAIPVCYFVFDLLAFGRFDLRQLPLDTRKRILARVVRGEGLVRFCNHTIGRGRAFFDAIAESGLEGTMAKLRGSPYIGGRTADWLKIKCPVTRSFVIGGYTPARGTRAQLGALLLGLWDGDDRLRFVGKVGSGFSDEVLSTLLRELSSRARTSCPFRRSAGSDRKIPRGAHFCEPTLACEVKFAEVTDNGSIRHPVFVRLLADSDPGSCRWVTPFAPASSTEKSEQTDRADRTVIDARGEQSPRVSVTHPEKIFWPKDGYTKADLVGYYEAVAGYMLPYLKDRPVMFERFPDGIEGKSFVQKAPPDFVPKWIRTEMIMDDTGGEKNYLIIESREALAWLANLGAIAIHIWSSRVRRLDHPDWLLFDLDPKGSTTANAVQVARELIAVLEKLGLRAAVKTSGQAGLHVCVGLEPRYSYQEAQNFCELVSRLVVSLIPTLATTARSISSRKGRVYLDYVQLGYGKTIAAPFTVRPRPRAPVSTPIRPRELRNGLAPECFNIRTVPSRMKRLRVDPFLGALRDLQTLESALPRLEALLKHEALLRS